MRHRVVLRDGNRPREQRDAVAPVPGLAPCEEGVHGDPGDRDRAERPRGATAASRLRSIEFREAEGQHHERTDQRQVRVTIRHRLGADLDQADHRHQRHQVPAPTNQQLRRAMASTNARRGHEHENKERTEHLPRRDALIWIRVINRKACRPDCPCEVRDVGHGGVRAARQERVLRDAPRSSAMGLNRVGHDARSRSEREHRYFFHDQPSPGLGAAERPHVEQQKQDRERHQHRLGEKTRSVGRQCEGAETNAWALEAGKPCVAREQTEDGAEHVLSLGDPRHGLDVERVDREERGDERAPPEAILHSQEKQEQQQYGSSMEHDVRRVETARGRAEAFCVQLQ